MECRTCVILLTNKVWRWRSTVQRAPPFENTPFRLCGSATMPPRLVVEYAKSAKATCKLCGETIAKGLVRLGSVNKADAGFDVTRWHHPKCFVTHYSIVGALGFEGLNGFSSLKPQDQAALKDTVADPELRTADGSPSQAKREGGSSDGIESLSTDYQEKLSAFNQSQLSKTYKDAILPETWKAFSTVIVGESGNPQASEKIAAFDFDGCLVRTSVQRHGADAWSLLYPSIPQKLLGYHREGYKLVIFTNESNIERWKNRRQKAIDSKLGRLNGFIERVRLPMQVFIACGKDGTGDPFRKPKPGMWTLMEHHFNGGIIADRGRSFYVGDAAGRPNDHSDADKGFAKAIGLEFLLPEDVFTSTTV